MISTICTACGGEFRIEFEMKGAGQTFMLPGTVPLRVRHCATGNFVDVPGKLIAFYEMVDGQQVKADPIRSDPLEN